MTITLKTRRHFGGRFGNEIQVSANISRSPDDDFEERRLTNVLVDILREGARENFIRLYFYNDPKERRQIDNIGADAPKTVLAALKARLSVAESAAAKYKAQCEALAAKLYTGAQTKQGALGL